MNDTAAVNARANLLQLVERAGGKPRRVSSEWRCACPIHKGDNPTGFAVYDDEMRWKCFTGDCGGGDAIDFVVKWQGISFLQACQYITGEKPLTPIEAAQLATQAAERAEQRLQRTIDEAQAALDELRSARRWLDYHRNLDDPEKQFRQLWRARGIPDAYQDLWQLGGAVSFSCQTHQGRWITDTLTIPVREMGGEVANVRHRLINPPSHNDKYRPERPGLSTKPFICDTDLADPQRVVVVEGEIKAAVFYLTLDDPKTQVIGLPGKTQFSTIAGLVGDGAIYIPDPGAERDWANTVKGRGRVAIVSDKVDDMINKYALGKDWAQALLRNARKV